MRYSIIMPYYNRPEIRFAFDSFCKLYSDRDDIEIIIVEDTKNFNSVDMHERLDSIIDKYKGSLKISLILDTCVSYNASTRYNRGVEKASGSIIMLTNPETPHTLDIFRELDKIDFSNTYIVCACSAMNLIEDKNNFFDSKFNFYLWYQHTQHRNANFHFCSAISKDNYNRIGGFDERYSKGIAFEDNNFVKRVEKSGLSIVTRDDLITYHIEHSRDYSLSKEETEAKIQINRSLWESQISSQKF